MKHLQSTMRSQPKPKQPKYTFGLLETPIDADLSTSKTGISSSSVESGNPSNSSSFRPKQPQQGARSSFQTTRNNSNNGNSSSLLAQTPGSICSAHLRTPKGRKGTSTPYTTSSTVSNDPNASTIVAVVEGRGQARGEIGLASIDIKQPVLQLSQFSDSQTYTKTLSKLQIISPLEIILPNTICESGNNSKLFSLVTNQFPNMQISSVQRRYFNETKGLQYIKYLCAAEYKSIELQISSKYYCLATAAALLKYIEFVQNVMFAPNSLKAVFRGCEYCTMIDSTTVKNLELLQNLKDPMSPHTLFGILNHTKTAGGSRLVRSNVLQPPNDEETIRLRHDAVMELTEKEDIFFSLQSVVSKFVDIGHIISTCVQIPKQETVKTAESKLTCVIMLKHVLQLVAPFKDNLENCENQLLKLYCKTLEDARYGIILGKIKEVINEEAHYQKGHLQQQVQKCMAVKSQINGFLDVARRTYSELINDLESYICQLADRYKLPLRTTYSSLRGYHIQMSTYEGGKGGSRYDGKVTPDNLPPVFLKITKFKGTLSFTTMDLLQLNERMKTALDEIYRMANVIVTDLLANIHEHIGCLYQLSDIVAMTDMLLAFAHTATLFSYVCPEFTDTLAIKQSFHPILQQISNDTLVPNDTYASEHSNLVVITGPNMSGKSTYLRQIAQLQIMAQIGSFVPAQYASLRIADQIFSRIGSDDDLESNSSTFTLEMKEMNYILQNITDNSLVIIDELGRGTSAEEGVGICWAVSEQLLKTKAYTFFVTHYKELTELNRNYPNVANYFFEVRRIFSAEASCEKVSYTHVLSRGVTPETHYGLQLAELSTMPVSVIADAKQIACELEKQKQKNQIGDAELIKQHAVFNLATRLIQVAKNSRMDGDSLRVYLKSLHRNYDTEINKIPHIVDNNSTNSDP